MIDAVGGKIVGRASSKIGEMPEAMKNVPEVGFVYNINMESLIGLKPDLVIANKINMRNFFRFWSLIKYLLLQSIQKHMMR